MKAILPAVFMAASASLLQLSANAQSANLWTIAPDSVPYVTSGITERGLAYDPVSDHLLLVSRAAGVGGLAVEVLDSSTGGAVGQLNTAGISGGLFPLDMIGVADDGAIYAANLTLGSTTSPFTIYRWANESAAPTIAYSGDPSLGANLRSGDTLKVRGAGASTQILVSAGGSASTFALFTSANGVQFSSQRFDVSGINAGDMRLGLAFGLGNTLFAKTVYGPLRYISFDPNTGTASLIGSWSIYNNLGGPIGVDRSQNLLVTLDVSNQFPLNHQADLINLAGIMQGVPYSWIPLSSTAFPGSNITSNGTGEVAFTPDGSRVFVLESQNGMMAFQLPPVPEPSIPAMASAAGLLFIWRRFMVKTNRRLGGEGGAPTA